MYNRKLKTHLIILLVFHACLVSGQVQDSVVVGYYHDGVIVDHWQTTLRHKTFQHKTLLLQEKYSSGRIAMEFFRFNDSLFFYTEYYEFPDTSVQYPVATWGVIREGLVQISTQNTGDTIVVFNPETYEEHLHMDTLLLPFGHWQFYYPDGKVAAEGDYLHFKRMGTWTYYDVFGESTKKVLYDHGNILETVFINAIEANSGEITLSKIQNTWLKHDLSVKPSYVPNPKLADFWFLYKSIGGNGIGDFYTFMEDQKLGYSKTKLVSTEYEKGDSGLNIKKYYDKVKTSKGYWTLIHHNQLEIILEGERLLFEIEYLSDMKIRLRKLKQ
ncbi:MAG: hypothetical protein ABL870_08695 [Sediminibacterium sp.]